MEALASPDVDRLTLSDVEDAIVASVFLLLRPDTLDSTTAAGSVATSRGGTGASRNGGGIFGSCIGGDAGDRGEVGVGGQRFAGTCGVGGVPGLSGVGDVGLDLDDFREEEDENNLDRLLLIFKDRCGPIVGVDGILVDP